MRLDPAVHVCVARVWDVAVNCCGLLVHVCEGGECGRLIATGSRRWMDGLMVHAGWLLSASVRGESRRRRIAGVMSSLLGFVSGQGLVTCQGLGS